MTEAYGMAATFTIPRRSKHNILITNATHFVIFEKHRFEFYKAVADFLKE